MCAVATKASRDTARRVASGQYSAGGPRPFGFERDGTTITPAEVAEIVQAADALLAGSHSRSTTPACPVPRPDQLLPKSSPDDKCQGPYRALVPTVGPTRACPILTSPAFPHPSPSPH